jgi:hypothetical protein
MENSHEFLVIQFLCFSCQGLLQVLWEHRFIDGHKKLSHDGKEVDRATGVVDLKTSLLRYILSQCPDDFQNEETAALLHSTCWVTLLVCQCLYTKVSFGTSW